MLLTIDNRTKESLVKVLRWLIAAFKPQAAVPTLQAAVPKPKYTIFGQPYTVPANPQARLNELNAEIQRHHESLSAAVNATGSYGVGGAESMFGKQSWYFHYEKKILEQVIASLQPQIY